MMSAVILSVAKVQQRITAKWKRLPFIIYKWMFQVRFFSDANFILIAITQRYIFLTGILLLTNQ